MFGLAFSLFLYVGSNVAYTADSQASLTQQWDQTHVPVAASGDDASPVLAFERPRLGYGQPLAKINVPSIKFVGVVLEGTDSRVLAGGPGHIPGTAYPGEPDNVVISNHNSYSLSWGSVKTGDLIELQTNYGSYKYRVTGFKIVDAHDTSVTGSSHPKPTLTFITCYPLWAGALATQRYVVFADLIQ
ncbi:MAG TPA: class D sortase [Candidatus Dormibacteraeota bacterium]|jgi:sortase A|nr:class D sortase [Candidatus Dormibacteraeota bacterium]